MMNLEKVTHSKQYAKNTTEKHPATQKVTYVHMFGNISTEMEHKHVHELGESSRKLQLQSLTKMVERASVMEIRLDRIDQM